MSEESANLERGLAVERLAYWQNVYKSALAANDDATAAQAQRFVKEYEEVIASHDRQPDGKD